MILSDKYSFANMMALSSVELKPILVELRQLIEESISEEQNKLPQVSWVKNVGAQDNKFVAARRLRKAFYNECERIVQQLSDLGHKLIFIDQDWDADYDFSSLSWSTSFRNNPNGLELTFYPKRTELEWRLSSFP